MLGFIIFIIILIYIGKYYRWTERLGYFKSMGITLLVALSIMFLAIIGSNMRLR